MIEPNFAADNFFLHFISLTDTVTITAFPYMKTISAVTTQKRIEKFYETYQKNFQKRKAEWAMIDSYHEDNLEQFKAVTAANNQEGTPEDLIEKQIRRRVDVTKFGWTNIDRMFKLLDEEILVKVNDTVDGKKALIQGIYVLDEINNAVLYYQGLQSCRPAISV